MGLCSSEEKLPNSGLFNYDEMKERIIVNSIEKINFKDLFMESLTPAFLKLFNENINLYYSPSFVEGISYEYGLFNKSKDMKKAFKIYKEAADFKYDYLCMYRMHRIYLTDYNDFGIKKNEDLHLLYLYKCFAYLPFLIIEKSYYLLNNIDVVNELVILLDEFEYNRFDTFDKFIDFLKNNRKQFNVTLNDIELMKYVFKFYFIDDENQNIGILNDLLNFERGDNAYFEAQLKYCNFYLKYSGENCDRQKIKNIFDDLMKAGYYKASCDYGRFLNEEKKYDESSIIFKKGSDNRQQFCVGEYTHWLLNTSNYNQLLTDYHLISYILKYICLLICLDKLGQGTLYYMIHYLIKHSSFKQKIQNDFGNYAKEIFQNENKYFKIENNDFIYKTFSEKFIIL